MRDGGRGDDRTEDFRHYAVFILIGPRDIHHWEKKPILKKTERNRNPAFPRVRQIAGTASPTSRAVTGLAFK